MRTNKKNNHRIQLCEICGNEYSYLTFRVKNFTDYKTGETLTGTKCPYCKHINQVKGKSTP